MPWQFKLPAAERCGRYFICGMVTFWLLLVLLLVLPHDPLWLLYIVLVAWLGSFLVTISSYIILLVHRLGLFTNEPPP